MNENASPSEDLIQPANDWQGISGLFDLLQTGGLVIGILIILSITSLTIILLKIWQFRHLREAHRLDARRKLDEFQTGQLKSAGSINNLEVYPPSRILWFVVSGRQHDMNDKRIRENANVYGLDVIADYSSNLKFLETIATLAPLLGLLGTVVGMIEAFQQLESAGNQVNPAILSSGIWKALLTTAAGLALAIPVVAVSNWLGKRIDSLAHEMDHILEGALVESIAITSPSDEVANAKNRPANEF